MDVSVTGNEHFMIFFSSDWHLWHSNIIKYSNRPFDIVEQMNSVILNNMNKKISNKDTLYFLGDFTFHKDIKKVYEFMNYLKCKKVHFIWGNHDKIIKKNREILLMDKVFLTIEAEHKIRTYINNEKKLIHCYHHSIRPSVWDKACYNNWHLYGHSHGNLLEDDSLSFDVGVDCWNFYPVSLDQVAEKMKIKRGHYEH